MIVSNLQKVQPGSPVRVIAPEGRLGHGTPLLHRSPGLCLVAALLISLIGLIALNSLPIKQYPSVAPPALSMTATCYPGADAMTVEQSVTQVIEQELNGVECLLYMA